MRNHLRIILNNNTKCIESIAKEREQNDKSREKYAAYNSGKIN